MIYLLTAIGLKPGGSSTVQYTVTHKQYTERQNNNNTYNNTKKIHRTTQKYNDIFPKRIN
jgi:hypothetical protein